MSDYVEQLPPHSEEAEMGVLGSILIDPDAFNELSPELTPDCFYRVANRYVFEAMVELNSRQVPIDMLTLREKLTQQDRLEDIGDAGYLFSLLNAVPTSINIHHYCNIIVAHYTSRELIAAASLIAMMAYEDTTVDEKIDKFTNIYYSLATKGRTQGDGPKSLKQLAEENLRQVENRTAETQIGIKSGFTELDMLLGGFIEERYYLLGARPGMGKTALLSAIAKNASLTGKRVGIISTEMGKMQLFVRLVADQLKMDTREASAMHMDHDRVADYMRAVGELSDLGIYIESSSDMNASSFRRRATRMKVKFGVDMILMDYLQLVEADDRNATGEQQVASVSRCMAGLTKKDSLNIPIIAAVQLNRSVENRQVKRPVNSDMKGSGALEADADGIMLLYRDEYYNPDTTDRANIAEVIIGKNRHGPTGIVDLYFNPVSASFRNLYRVEIPLPKLDLGHTHASFSSNAYGD